MAFLDPLRNSHKDKEAQVLIGLLILTCKQEREVMFSESLATVFLLLFLGDEVGIPQLLAVASRLRDTAELFQSDEMRPANDPKERAPLRVRMLNDVLQSLEKSFLVHRAPPGLYRYGVQHVLHLSSKDNLALPGFQNCHALIKKVSVSIQD